MKKRGNNAQDLTWQPKSSKTIDFYIKLLLKNVSHQSITALKVKEI